MRPRLVLLACCTLVALAWLRAGPVRAQRPAPAVPPPAGADSAPVPVPPASPRAVAYARGNTLLWLVDLVVGIAVPALVFVSGLSARLRTAARRVGRGWLGTTIVYFLLLGVCFGLVTLPLTFYESFVREHAFGLSTQTLGRWARDLLIGSAVSLALGAALVGLPVLLLRRSPRRWWLWSGLAAFPLLALLQLVAPIWLAPLFNRFGPMHDRALETEVRTLAHRAGLAHVAVFEVDKSADTRALNAYVAGLGGTRRVVLWDTLLRRLDRREVLAVTAHELGHYVLHHVWLGILTGGTLLLAALWAVHRAAGRALARWGPRAGVHELADPAALPLLAALGGVALAVLGPVGLAVSRHLEHEADRFALELTRDNRALARSFVVLQQDNLGDPWPSPLVRLLRYSHPPLGERITFANTYRPWARGAPLRHGARFVPPAGGEGPE
ncbi:MAG TPA: M48 family metallopeptidase [Gemmatimonadales bacterium]|nr:M48 family metallopeptidase [Gemmatimonadales bacterium]